MASLAPPSCPAAAAGQCTALTCAELAREGRCMSRELHVTDWDRRSVTQHCSAQCGCPALPTLRQSLAGPGADACCAFRAGMYFTGADGKPTTGL